MRKLYTQLTQRSSNNDRHEAYMKSAIIDEYQTVFTCEKENLLKVEQTQSRILKHLYAMKKSTERIMLRASYTQCAHRMCVCVFVRSFLLLFCVFSIYILCVNKQRHVCLYIWLCCSVSCSYRFLLLLSHWHARTSSSVGCRYMAH